MPKRTNKGLSLISALMMLVTTFVMKGCSSNRIIEDIPDPCADQDCSGRGVCGVMEDGEAVCICDPGYRAEGLSCIKELDRCDPDESCQEGYTCIDGFCMPDSQDVDGTPDSADNNVSNEAQYDPRMGNHLVFVTFDFSGSIVPAPVDDDVVIPWFNKAGPVLYKHKSAFD